MDENKYENVSAPNRKEDSQKLAGLPFKLKKDNFLIMILIGVLLLVIAWPTGGSEKETEMKKEQGSLMADGDKSNNEYVFSQMTEMAAEDMTADGMLAYASYLEDTLEGLLSSMDGAGKVKVMITMESSGEAVLEKDIVKQREGTTEVDSAGGSRNTANISEQEETVYAEGDSNRQTPYIKRINAPKVQGVLVAAEGGQNTKVAKNITEAIQALFGIEAHKIKIVKMNSQ